MLQGVNMKRLTIILTILSSIELVSCDTSYKSSSTNTMNSKQYKQPPIQVSKEYLIGKKFISDRGIMSSKSFTFIDSNKVDYTIDDKTAYGYDGTYSFEYDDRGKQYIKIIEKQGGLTVKLLVKSPTQLKVISAEPKFYTPQSAPFKSANVSPPLSNTYELWINRP